MSLPPVFEAFEKRVIPFPEDLLQGRNALPLRCKLYLGLTAAAMLFPRDREGFAGYVAQETVSFISEVEALEVESRAETGIEVEAEMEFLEGAHHKIYESPRYLFGSRNIYSRHIRWAGFTAKGKGSLEERFFQGKICGFIYMLQSLSEKTLKESIEFFVSKYDVIFDKDERTVGPMCTVSNIQNNIWPRFKDIAWLWAPTWYTTIPMDSQRIYLDEIQLAYNFFADVELRDGWYGFIDAALRFYKVARDNEIRAGESPPADGTIWKFHFIPADDEKNHTGNYLTS